MGAFKKFNGKTGFKEIFHTSTGYRCKANVMCPDDINKNISFFAKHIVGADGKPYTEIGFDCEEPFNQRDIMVKSKLVLVKAGFEEVSSVSDFEESNLAFCEYKTPIPNLIEIRVNASKDGVVKVFEAMSDYISEDCIEFVRDQEEEVEENLYFSILESMGDEMKMGPGGEDFADKKAREMAHMFIYGLEEDESLQEESAMA